MAQSLAKNLIHLVFSVKNRAGCLNEKIRAPLWAYMAGILQEWDSPALVIGGVEDHVHILFMLSKNHALKKIVEEVKTGSSIWIKQQSSKFADFHWQRGYGAFSVSESSVPAVRLYIENQAEHHRKITFQDELRELLRRHGLEFDERYLWD